MSDKIYVEYDTSRSGGEPDDPDDRWTNHSDTVVNVEFTKLYRNQPSHRFFYDSIDVDDPKLLEHDTLFLAVVRYGTGDTFGHTTGAWSIIGVAASEEEASAMLEQAIKPSKKGDYSHYKPWEGYFESLEGTEIHELSLE